MPETETTETAPAFEIIDAEDVHIDVVIEALLGKPGQLLELSARVDQSGPAVGLVGRVRRLFTEGERLRWVELEQGGGDVVRVRWSAIDRITPWAE